MKFQKGSGDFFALDIGTNAVRVLQLAPTNDQWELVAHGYAPIDRRIVGSDTPDARRRLGETITTAIGQSGIRTKNVAIGLPSNKTFTTIVDVPQISDTELRATMKYQIDQYVPMSDDAKVDWALLGPSLRAKEQQEVLITSVSKAYSEDRLEFIESLGLNVIAIEPDPIAMVRALAPAKTDSQAALLIDIGELSTDLAIVYGGAPRLVRTIPSGLASFVKAAVQNLSVQDDQARQFILKFGLAEDRLDGQVVRAVEGTLDSFASELTKSIKFFQTRYNNTQVATITLAGFGQIIPHFGEYIAAQVSVPAAPGDPWQRVSMPQSSQEQLAHVAAEFATAVGLAKRRNTA
mgnify:CR=1 FL=1